MNGRTRAAAGTGVTVVLGGVSAALINELDGGRPWWVAAAAVVVISALVSAWLVHRSSSPKSEVG